MNVRMWVSLAVLVASVEVLAADFGPPRAIAETFNDIAKIAGVEPRLILRNCKQRDSACMFSAGGNITILAIADDQSPRKTQLIVIGADSSSDPKAFVSVATNAMMAFSPSPDVGEIKTVLSVLFKPPIADRTRSATVKGVTYTLKPFGGGAVFFTIADSGL